jgi:MFS transporter, DHA1 family, tetracycline resistance protein
MRWFGRSDGNARATTMGPLLAINFVAALGFSIVIPFLVFLVTRLGGNAVVYGITAATYSVFQLVGAPLLGRWSDRFGRKRILFVSQLGTALSWGLFLVALAIPTTPLVRVHSGILGSFTLTVPLLVLIAARALDGATGANTSVANAYLADVTAERGRVRAFGRLAMSGNLGFIVGPALAGLLGATAWGETAPVVAACATSGIACLMILVGLTDAAPCPPEGLPERPTAPRAMGQEPKDCFKGVRARRKPLSEIFALRGVSRLLGLNLLVFLAFNLFYVAFPSYVVQRLRWTLAQTGTFFAVLSLLMVIVQGPVLSRAARRASERTLVLGGSLILAVSFLFFTTPRAAWLYVGAAVLALGNGLMWPSLLALLSDAAGTEAQGAVQGLAGTGNALASITGLVVGGLLFQRLGPAVFDLSAVIAGVTCLVALAIPRAGKETRGAVRP